GLIAILWDVENCLVPKDVRQEDIVGNIWMDLRSHPTIHGPMIVLSAYRDFD
ncbi:Hypothetical predicted protein, partial [Olea europaea subsp. europaea]